VLVEKDLFALLHFRSEDVFGSRNLMEVRAVSGRTRLVFEKVLTIF